MSLRKFNPEDSSAPEVNQGSMESPDEKKAKDELRGNELDGQLCLSWIKGKEASLSDSIQLRNVEKMKYLPVSDGYWNGEKGNSTWIPNDDKIPRKSNSEGKSWNEIKSLYNIDGISFKDGEPDFSKVSRTEVKVFDFSDERNKNFKQADIAEALNRGCDPEEVKEWRKKNGYTWHELKDCETMQKVPSEIHNNIVHSGGISEKKKELSLEGWN